MKTNSFQAFAAFLAASIIVPVSIASAQDYTTVTAVNPDRDSQSAVAATPAPAPQLAYGVSQIVQLSQARVPDDTIVTYIKNSGTSYGLNADQIIYLQQQGVSTTVLNAMLNQPRPSAYVPVPAAPAPAVSYATYDSQPAPSTVVVTPPITAIDPTAAAVNASYYYYEPAYYPYYYSYPYYYPGYRYYGCYPGVSVSFGWGRGWGGYGGWHGGYGWRGGDFHREFNGGFHGGFNGGFHGGFNGGFHGGGGGFHGGGGGGGFHGGFHH